MRSAKARSESLAAPPPGEAQAAEGRVRSESWAPRSDHCPATPKTPRELNGNSMRSFVHSSIDLVSAGGLGEDGLPAGQGTVIGSVFVFVQSIVGAGLLTYPSAYKNSGIGSILLLQGLLMGAIVSGLRYLAFAAHISHADTYQRMMRNIGGARLERACESCVVLVCFGACVAYLDIIIDQVRPLVLALAGESDAAANVGWYGARSIIAVFAAVATFALCLIRNISGLSFPSMCGVIGMVFVTVVLAWTHFVQHDPSRNINGQAPPSLPKLVWFRSNPLAWISALPVICFSFQGHISAIPLYAEMRHRTLSKFDHVIGWGLLICIFIYNFTGYVGYASFGDSTSSDILVNLSDRSALVGVARLCVALSVATSYAILHFCARKVLLGRFGGQIRCLCGEQRPAGVPQLSGEDARNGPFMFVTTLWALVVLLCVIQFPDVGQVVGFVGNLAACFMFIFPGIALIKLGTPPDTTAAQSSPAQLLGKKSERKTMSAPLLRKPASEAGHPSASAAVAARRGELRTSGWIFVAFGCCIFIVGVTSCMFTALG